MGQKAAGRGVHGLGLLCHAEPDVHAPCLPEPPVREAGGAAPLGFCRFSFTLPREESAFGREGESLYS